MINLTYFLIGLSVLAGGFMALAFLSLLTTYVTIERMKAVGFIVRNGDEKRRFVCLSAFLGTDAENDGIRTYY